MDVQRYIESGILQDYCLGILSKEENTQVEAYAARYPEIMAEIHSWQQVLEQYAINFSQVVPAGLKSRTLDRLDSLLNETNDEFPLLNKHANRENWLRLVKQHLPEELAEETFSKVLRDDEQVFQAVLWTKVNYPDEVHDDLEECFMILEGECECYSGDEIIKLGPGGFFDVPMHTHHDVKVIKGPVLAIIQRLKVA